MLTWAFIFLGVSIVAGLLGFSGVAKGAAGVSKLLFGLFLLVFLVLLLLALFGTAAAV